MTESVLWTGRNRLTHVKMANISAKSSINFNINFKGNGSCFNYEGNTNVLEPLIKTNDHQERPITMDWGTKINAKDAISYAKVHVYPDGSFCFKVSSDCLKKGIYSNSIINRVQSNNISAMPAKFKTSFFSDPLVLLHGYFSAVSNEKICATVAKSGALRITSARECDEKDFVTPLHRNELILEQSFKTPVGAENPTPFTRSGSCCSKHFVSEDCSLDLSELQFISNDSLHGRNALMMSTEEAEDFVKALKASLNVDDIKYGFFKKAHETSDFVGEYGVKLGKKAIKKLVLIAFNSILGAEWNKLRGSLSVDSITLSSFNGGLTLTRENVDSIDLDIDDAYIEVEDPSKVSDWENACKELDELLSEKKSKAKEEKSKKSNKAKTENAEGSFSE